LLELHGATVIVDYGHNPASLAALLEVMEQFPHQRRLAVYSTAGDRPDCDLIRQGERLAGAFDRVILYEAPHVRGAQQGEIMALFRKGLEAGGRVTEVLEVRGAIKALETAIRQARPGDLMLLQADEIDETVNYVRNYLASGNVGREITFREAVALGQ